MFNNGVLPAGVRSMSAEEFISMFCTNYTRMKYYTEGLKRAAQFLAKNGIPWVYVGGGFVDLADHYQWTKDIDCFFILKIEDWPRVLVTLEKYAQWKEDLWNQHRCGLNAVFEDFGEYEHKGRKWESQLQYFMDLYGHTREDDPRGRIEKGIVKLGTDDILKGGSK